MIGNVMIFDLTKKCSSNLIPVIGEESGPEYFTEGGGIIPPRE